MNLFYKKAILQTWIFHIFFSQEKEKNKQAIV